MRLTGRRRRARRYRGAAWHTVERGGVGVDRRVLGAPILSAGEGGVIARF